MLLTIRVATVRITQSASISSSKTDCFGEEGRPPERVLPEQISARPPGSFAQKFRERRHRPPGSRLTPGGEELGEELGRQGSTLSGQLLPVLQIWCLLQEKHGSDVIMGEAVFNGARPLASWLCLWWPPQLQPGVRGPSQAAPRSRPWSHAAPSSQQLPCYPSRGNAKTLLENEGPLYLNNKTLRTASYPGIKIFTGKENDSPYPPPHTRALPRSQLRVSGLYLGQGPLSSHLPNPRSSQMS